MKKLLVFLVMMSLVAMMPMVIGEPQQDLMVSVQSMTNINITPDLLNFGPVVPGTIGSVPVDKNIVFDATGSNGDITVSVSSITAGLFLNGLMLDGSSALNFTKTLVCNIDNNVCSYDKTPVVPTLNVPLGTLAGTQTGVINYLISAAKFCGDDIKNRASEVCDGTDLNSKTCLTEGFNGGTLSCKLDCTGFNTSLCTSSS
ncbi:hypothetical protein J4429_04030 [Candidatus Pacearchaeota archaeon]|nr:hypothetical protein [Candidatus Pacearchaeota archaeon]